MQVAAVVPYGVGSGSAQVSVTYLGNASTLPPVNIGASAPGLFTLDSTGRGQAAAVNQNGSVNTASTPEKTGNVITLFATGEGQTNPAGVDGKPSSMPFPVPLLPVSVMIGGKVANVQYVGGAPGEVAGDCRSMCRFLTELKLVLRSRFHFKSATQRASPVSQSRSCKHGVLLLLRETSSCVPGACRWGSHLCHCEPDPIQTAIAKNCNRFAMLDLD